MKKIAVFILMFALLGGVFEAKAQSQTIQVPRYYTEPFSKPPMQPGSEKNSIEFSMNYDYMLPRSYEDAKRFHDTSIEVKGWNSISFFDVYWSWNFSNFMRTSVLSNLDKSSKNYQYGMLAPRLSINKMVSSDLSFLFLKEWFISYRFEFDSPDAKGSKLLKHNIGLGVDLAIPLFKRFKTNFYVRYTEKNYGLNNNTWDGYLFSADYLVSIYKFPTAGIEFLYEGWLDVVFGAKVNNSSRQQQTKESIKWKNTFKISFQGLAIGYTYQFNMNPNNIKYRYYDTSSQSVGISYTYNF